MTNAKSFSIAARPRAAPAVVVIGAGVGGLAAAVWLASGGAEVTVLERAGTVGGKLRCLTVDGASIDVGPTVFTMRPVFEELFAAAGASLEAELPTSPADILARHAWSPGETLDLWADVEQSADAVARFAGPEEGRRFRAFSDRAARVYRMLEQPFILSPAPSILGLVRAIGPGRDLFGISPFTSLWTALGAQFKDPRLRQLFGRYATYCGSSPFQCPATLMLVAHVEQQGVWLIEGGMHRLASAMARVATRLGVDIRLNTEVDRITLDQGRAAGVVLATGERLTADAVVCNADVAALAAGSFGPGVTRAASGPSRRHRSLSAVTTALHVETDGFPLQRHNVFFSRDYRAEFDDLTRTRRLPLDPTVYVCAQDRDGVGDRRPGTAAERLFVIVNAPADGDTTSFGAAEMAQCEARTFRTLERCGLRIAMRPGCAQVTTPSDFDRLFPATGGALYGAASHGWRASFSRPGMRSRIPGLYLCGGSTHPGPGLPMAAISGRMAAASLIEDWVSTPRWRRTAIAGGMSTA